MTEAERLASTKPMALLEFLKVGGIRRKTRFVCGRISGYLKPMLTDQASIHTPRAESRPE
jgi:hypothetical protein